MAIFGLKMAILDFKMAKELSKNIFIWTAAINCTSNLGFIHFTTLFITFLSRQYQKGLKMGIFGLKMAILDFKMAKEHSENIFIWMAVINCTSNLGFIHFTIFVIAFLSLQCQKGLKLAIYTFFMDWKLLDTQLLEHSDPLLLQICPSINQRIVVR